MKKFVCFVLALLVLGSLTACTFTQNMSGMAAGEAESAPMVEKMMLALAENKAADAKALLHPQIVETSDSAISQMCAYLAGRKADAMELTGINVNTSTGTAGTSRQERINYRITLADGDTIYINAVYLSNNQGAGFVSFQLVLGVV